MLYIIDETHLLQYLNHLLSCLLTLFLLCIKFRWAIIIRVRWKQRWLTWMSSDLFAHGGEQSSLKIGRERIVQHKEKKSNGELKIQILFIVKCIADTIYCGTFCFYCVFGIILLVPNGCQTESPRDWMRHQVAESRSQKQPRDIICCIPVSLLRFGCHKTPKCTHIFSRLHTIPSCRDSGGVLMKNSDFSCATFVVSKYKVFSAAWCLAGRFFLVSIMSWHNK